MNKMTNNNNKEKMENEFLKKCVDLCLERMEAEGIDSSEYLNIHFIEASAGIAVFLLQNFEDHKQIAFHVYYEGNRYSGTPIYALPFKLNGTEDTYTNTAREAVCTLFMSVL